MDENELGAHEHCPHNLGTTFWNEVSCSSLVRCCRCGVEATQHYEMRPPFGHGDYAPKSLVGQEIVWPSV